MVWIYGFENLEAGIQSDVEVFVDTDASVKFVIIHLQNLSGDDRKLSLTGYIEWILGDLHAKTGMHVITEYDALTGTFLLTIITIRNLKEGFVF